VRWLLLALLACGADEKPVAPITGSAPPPKPPLISDAVRDRVCKAEPCGGGRSSIDLYRDGNGTLKKLYRLYGPCSHNPGIYFDPDGTQTEIIPEQPIEPGSDEAKAFQAKHDKQVGGLTKAETVRCP
jgi:hypothetical protein